MQHYLQSTVYAISVCLSVTLCTVSSDYSFTSDFCQSINQSWIYMAHKRKANALFRHLVARSL